MKGKKKPSCDHCGDTGLVVWEAGDQQSVDPCQCLLDKGICVNVRGGAVKLFLAEGGSAILKLHDNGGCDGSPPNCVGIAIERSDLKKLVKALKKGKRIMKALGQK